MTDKTILEEWKSLYNFRIEEDHLVNKACELTDEVSGDVVSLKFYPPVSFQQLFSFLENIIKPVPQYAFSDWDFSNQILNMTPQELKANIALGVIPIDKSDWLR